MTASAVCRGRGPAWGFGARPLRAPVDRLACDGEAPSAVLVLQQQLPEAGVLADRVQVVVLPYVAEVPVTQLDGPAKRSQGLVGAVQQRVAAGQVVMGQRILGPKMHQTLVDLQP